MFGPKPGGTTEGGGWDDDTKRAYKKAVKPLSEAGKENPKRWRIAWKIRSTGKTGHGEYVFDKQEDTEPWIKDMNKKYPDMNHWAEREP